jgi:polyisoprenoid-binding protein YceI
MMQLSPTRFGFAVFALAFASVMSMSAATQPLDAAKSVLRIHVGKAGLFSAAGHEHWVTARIDHGELATGDAPHVAFSVDARKMTVEPDPKLRASDQAEVQRTMQTKVLESEKYPEISFRSTNIENTGPNTWFVTGDLNLHNAQKPVRVEVRYENGAYIGHARIKQTDFGIQPVKVGGGLVKVKDELEIEFTIITLNSRSSP